MKVWIVEAAHFAEGTTILAVLKSKPTPAQVDALLRKEGWTDKDLKPQIGAAPMGLEGTHEYDPQVEADLTEWDVG